MDDNQPGLQRAELPRDLHQRFNAIADARLHRQRALVHIWVVRAARLALHEVGGSGDLLPDPRTLGTLGTARSRVKWIQAEDEYARCRELVEGAGSSVPAVLRVAITYYVAAEGDLLRLPLRTM